MSARSIATAEQLRNRRILVPVPGSELTLECRRPDPLEQAVQKVLPLEVYAEVTANIDGSLESAESWMKNAIKDPQLYGDYVNRWCVVAIVKPVVVLTQDEAAANPDHVWVEDLEPELLIDVFRKTNDRHASRRVSDALKAFRERQPVHPASGRDGAAISGAAVAAAPVAG